MFLVLNKEKILSYEKIPVSKWGRNILPDLSESGSGASTKRKGSIV